MSNVVKCQVSCYVMKYKMSWNVMKFQMSWNVKSNEMLNIMKFQMSWNVKCNEISNISKCWCWCWIYDPCVSVCLDIFLSCGLSLVWILYRDLRCWWLEWVSALKNTKEGIFGALHAICCITKQFMWGRTIHEPEKIQGHCNSHMHLRF